MRELRTKSRNAHLVIRGLDAPSRFESLKQEADEAFRLKQYARALEAYERVAVGMERLESGEFERENKQRIYEKSNGGRNRQPCRTRGRR